MFLSKKLIESRYKPLVILNYLKYILVIITSFDIICINNYQGAAKTSYATT